MFRNGWRRLARARQLAAFVARDPVEAMIEFRTLLAERAQRWRPASSYEVDPAAERRLHAFLGIPWPCAAVAEFWDVWPEVLGALRAKGLRVGRGTFSCYNDGDPGLLRVVWCLTRHLRPACVVETGVARGLTSRVILEALERNGTGHLWSIDRPPPVKRELHREVGAAVGNFPRHRWSYIRGSSRRRLPGLLSRLGQIDLFVHDSRHSGDNVVFELEQAWRALRPGGVAVVDDVDLNWGFGWFTQNHTGLRSLVCSSEPLQHDLSRHGSRGLFGVICKETPKAEAAAAETIRSSRRPRQT